MAYSIAHVHHVYPSSGFIHSLHSFGSAAKENLSVTAQKIKEFMEVPTNKILIGLGIGVCMHVVYTPLTERIIKFFGLSATAPDPFNELSDDSKIFFRHSSVL